MTKYLVLGSSGQIGIALVDYLRRLKYTVFEFDIVNSQDEDLRIYNNSLLRKFMHNCDFIFLLAFDGGGSPYLKKYQDTYDFISNNIKIMNTTFDMLKECKKKFIFTSSQMSNMPYSSYGVLKAIGKYYTRALQGLVVKFWNVYGIEKDLRKAHVITDFILKARHKCCIDMLTDGSEVRQFLYADDAAEALYILSEKYAEIPRDKEINITSFEWVNILSIAQMVAECFEGIKIIPGQLKDEVQLDKHNEPDTFIYKYWRPKTKLNDGIRRIAQFYI